MRRKKRRKDRTEARLKWRNFFVVQHERRVKRYIHTNIFSWRRTMCSNVDTKYLEKKSCSHWQNVIACIIIIILPLRSTSCFPFSCCCCLCRRHCWWCFIFFLYIFLFFLHLGSVLASEWLRLSFLRTLHGMYVPNVHTTRCIKRWTRRQH